MGKFKYPRHTALRIASAVVLTLIAAVFASNFIGGEKKIGQRVERLYALDDPRFRYELGLLLGPPFVAGNRHTVLRNGDEIFPPMLAAIRGAATSITYFTRRIGRTWGV